jgi:phosphopentomutase
VGIRIILKQKKLILIILKNAGMGELPNADKHEDRGANSISDIARTVSSLQLPNLASLRFEYGLHA